MTNPLEPVVRLAGETDLPRIAELHFNELSQTFLAKLGLPYLREKFYPKLLRHRESFIMVAEVDGIVRSFVAFTLSGTALEAYLTATKRDEVVFIVTAALRHPHICLDILALLLGAKVTIDPGWEAVEENAELFSIASDSKFQSRGLGRILIREGLSHLRASTASSNPSCFVRTDTDRARSFYKRQGFIDIGTEKRGLTHRFILAQKLSSVV